MPWPTCPCKGCDSRYVGCHSKCDPYKDFKSELDDISAKRKAENAKRLSCRSKASVKRKYIRQSF